MHLTHKNIQLSYTEQGSGNTVVLLHGFLENQKMWSAYISTLTQKNRVITIDLLGHGETECIGYVHTMEDMAEAVYAVLKSLRVKKAHFVGHSMGGYVSLALAELYPTLIRKIMLLNSTSREDSFERKQNRERAIEAVKTNKNTFIQMAIANLFSPDNREKLSAEIEIVKTEALKTSTQGVIAAIEGMKIRKDRFFLIEKNDFPVYIVVGKKDPVLDISDIQLQAHSPNVTLITFNDGHMSHIENQNELQQVLTSFVKN